MKLKIQNLEALIISTLQCVKFKQLIIRIFHCIPRVPRAKMERLLLSLRRGSPNAIKLRGNTNAILPQSLVAPSKSPPGGLIYAHNFSLAVNTKRRHGDIFPAFPSLF